MGAKFSELDYKLEYEKNANTLTKPIAQMNTIEFVSYLAKDLYQEFCEEQFEEKYVNQMIIHLEICRALYYWLRAINYYFPHDYADEYESTDLLLEFKERIITVFLLGDYRKRRGYERWEAGIKESLEDYAKNECWDFYKGRAVIEFPECLPKVLTGIIFDYVNSKPPAWKTLIDYSLVDD